VKFVDKAVTEIICHGTGAHFLNPLVRSVIDIGGQDSKAIALDEHGKVKNFAVNDKCAAGTGRFLEVMANALEADLDSFGEMSLKADRPAGISSLCTVFAESEVISLIAKGESRVNIHRRHPRIHRRKSIRPGEPRRNRAAGGDDGGRGEERRCREGPGEKLGVPIEVSPFAQVNGAIGAAIIAAGLR